MNYVHKIAILIENLSFFVFCLLLVFNSLSIKLIRHLVTLYNICYPDRYVRFYIYFYKYPKENTIQLSCRVSTS